MCPACIATFVLIAASATSAGGLTALAAKKLKKLESKTQNKGERYGYSKGK